MDVLYFASVDVNRHQATCGKI